LIRSSSSGSSRIQVLANTRKLIELVDRSFEIQHSQLLLLMIGKLCCSHSQLNLFLIKAFEQSNNSCCGKWNINKLTSAKKQKKNANCTFFQRNLNINELVNQFKLKGKRGEKCTN